VIIPGAPAVGRNQDGQYVFRQRSGFFFLTGFDEPDAVAVLKPSGAQERFVLFVRPRDRDLEIWNGHRAGTEGRSRRMALTPRTRRMIGCPHVKGRKLPSSPEHRGVGFLEHRLSAMASQPSLGHTGGFRTPQSPKADQDALPR
jgi:hypothetical protein